LVLFIVIGRSQDQNRNLRVGQIFHQRFGHLFGFRVLLSVQKHQTTKNNKQEIKKTFEREREREKKNQTSRPIQENTTLLARGQLGVIDMESAIGPRKVKTKG
jgi:hypothetical protein